MKEKKYGSEAQKILLTESQKEKKSNLKKKVQIKLQEGYITKYIGLEKSIMTHNNQDQVNQ